MRFSLNKPLTVVTAGLKKFSPIILIVSDETGNRPIKLAILACLRRKLFFGLVPKRFDFAIALVEFYKGKMAVNDFRMRMSRLKEVQEQLERSDQSSLVSKLPDVIDGSLSIIEVKEIRRSFQIQFYKPWTRCRLQHRMALELLKNVLTHWKPK